MKKIIILFLALSFNFSSAQFSAFFSFQTDSPESVVAVMDNMMSSEVGKKFLREFLFLAYRLLDMKKLLTWLVLIFQMLMLFNHL